MDWQETRSFLGGCFPEAIRAEMEMLLEGELREIRIRADRPCVFVTATRTAELPWRPGPMELAATVEALSEHALHTRVDETQQGFVTLRGGHRMGLCGRAALRDGRVRLIDTGSVCIRIAAQWKGCAELLTPLVRQESGSLGSMIIIGPPGSGKTTLLRDLTRDMGKCPDCPIAVVDERGEIAACVEGVPQLDVGNADVLAGLPRTIAMPWLIRTMSPRMIITDEIGSPADAECILDALSAGVQVCASLHGRSLQDAAQRPAAAQLMSRRVFSSYCVLDPAGGGRIAALHDRSGQPLPLP